MFSMRMDMWRAPRPETLKLSAVSPGSTRSARLRSSSRSSLSFMFRLFVRQRGSSCEGGIS